jgi:hypothetical protein
MLLFTYIPSPPPSSLHSHVPICCSSCSPSCSYRMHNIVCYSSNYPYKMGHASWLNPHPPHSFAQTPPGAQLPEVAPGGFRLTDVAFTSGAAFGSYNCHKSQNEDPTSRHSHLPNPLHVYPPPFLPSPLLPSSPSHPPSSLHSHVPSVRCLHCPEEKFNEAAYPKATDHRKPPAIPPKPVQVPVPA